MAQPLAEALSASSYRKDAINSYPFPYVILTPFLPFLLFVVAGGANFQSKNLHADNKRDRRQIQTGNYLICRLPADKRNWVGRGAPDGKKRARSAWDNSARRARWDRDSTASLTRYAPTCKYPTDPIPHTHRARRRLQRLQAEDGAGGVGHAPRLLCGVGHAPWLLCGGDRAKLEGDAPRGEPRTREAPCPAGGPRACAQPRVL